jgi:hypothetical protein
LYVESTTRGETQGSSGKEEEDKEEELLLLLVIGAGSGGGNSSSSKPTSRRLGLLFLTRAELVLDLRFGVYFISGFVIRRHLFRGGHGKQSGFLEQSKGSCGGGCSATYWLVF